MTVSIGGAVKAVILAADLGISDVYRELAPDTATFPYVVFNEPMSDVPTLKGDGRTIGKMMVVQVDLWESMDEESTTLRKALVASLDGAKLTDTEVLVWKVQVSDVRAVPDPRPRFVHHAITLRIAHAA